MARLITITGTIEIDGVESKFQIDNNINESWYQWGATQDRLWDSSHIVEAIDRAVKEEVEWYNEEEE